MRFKFKEGKKSFYECGMKKEKGCPVKVSLDNEQDLILEKRGDHNHDNELLKEEVRSQVLKKLETVADQPYTSPRSVFQDITKSVLNCQQTKEGLAYLPKPKTFAKSLQRKRRTILDCPALPTCFEDFSVPEKFKETTDGKPFLIVETQLESKDGKVVGFASPTMLNELNQSDEWFVDGTWDIVRDTFFLQAWVIVARTRHGVSLPCCYFLLPDKKPASYQLALNALKSHGVEGPRTVHLDFEKAEFKAFNEEYPNTEIVTCLVHWDRAIRRKQTDLKLIPFINRDITIQQFFKKVKALCYVPVEDVPTVWSALLEDAPVLDDEDEETEDTNNSIESWNSVSKCEHQVFLMMRMKKQKIWPTSSTRQCNHSRYILKVLGLGRRRERKKQKQYSTLKCGTGDKKHWMKKKLQTILLKAGTV